MAKIQIMNLLQPDGVIQSDLWLSGLGMSAPGRARDEGGRLRLPPGKWVKVEVARDTAMSIEVAREVKPEVSRETLVDRLTDAAHSVYDGVQEDEEELSNEAYLAYHDVLHALGITRSTAKPEAPVEPKPVEPLPDEPMIDPSPGDSLAKPSDQLDTITNRFAIDPPPGDSPAQTRPYPDCAP